MKEYVRPTIEMVELRPEERLAGCTWGIQGPSLGEAIFCWLFHKKTGCKNAWICGGGNS